MQKVRYPTKTVLGVAIASVLSLYGAIDYYGGQAERNSSAGDPYLIGAQEERFGALKRELPNVKVMGYVSDVTAQPAVFLSAQYALAPVLLVAPGEADSRGEVEWIIGNFSKALDYAEFGRAQKLTVVKDFGSGVVLYRKAG